MPSPFWSGGGSDATSTSSSWSGLDPKALDNWSSMWSGLNQGIAPWQQAGFNQAMTSALDKFSALKAARGGVSPFDAGQVASSAAQYTVPQFAALNTQMMGNLLGQRQISMSSSNATHKTTTPGMGYVFGSALGKSLGTSIGEWAAPSTWGFGTGGKNTPTF